MRKLQFSYDKLYALQNGRCFYCSTHMYNHIWEDRKKRRMGWTRDHFLPRSLGYGLTGNCVLACRTCNERKGDSIPAPILFHKIVLLRSHFMNGVHPVILEFLRIQRIIDWPIRG